MLLTVHSYNNCPLVPNDLGECPVPAHLHLLGLASCSLITSSIPFTVNPVYLTLLNFNVFLKTCVLTFIIITISQCVLVWKHTVPSD